MDAFFFFSASLFFFAFVDLPFTVTIDRSERLLIQGRFLSFFFFFFFLVFMLLVVCSPTGRFVLLFRPRPAERVFIAVYVFFSIYMVEFAVMYCFVMFFFFFLI